MPPKTLDISSFLDLRGEDSKTCCRLDGRGSEKVIRGRGPKIFENSSVTGTSKSQNGSITETKICPKRPFSQNFRGVFGAATDFELCKAIINYISVIALLKFEPLRRWAGRHNPILRYKN